LKKKFYVLEEFGMDEKTFEVTITETLKGDSQKNALDFAAFLKAHGMTTGGEHGEINLNGKAMAYIHMDGKAEAPGPWTIWPDGDFSSVPDGFEFDEKMKEIARANVNICGDCGCECAPGARKSIFGREFDNVCGGAVIAFNDPRPEAIACAKKLLEMKM
jgi:hypothetical protein